MKYNGLYLVQELHASVEGGDEDLSEYAIFRKHTLALLRYYFRLSMEYGRMPSMLGGQVSRARISHYKMHTLEDDTIFLHDLDRCMQQELSEGELRLVAVVVFLEHTFEEASVLLGYSSRQVVRMHAEALNKLTRAFCEREFLKIPELKLARRKPMAKSHAAEIKANAAI